MSPVTPSLGAEALLADIRGLTLYRPWAWAICHAGKRIENRGRRPPIPIGSFLVIHAGKMLDEESRQHLIARYLNVPSDGGPQGIVAVAKLVYCFDGDTDKLVDLLGEAEATIQLRDWLSDDGFGWVLSDVVVFPRPIPCRGAQGLWPIPGDLLSVVRAGWRAGHG